MMGKKILVVASLALLVNARGTMAAESGASADAIHAQFLEAMQYRAEGRYDEAISLFTTILSRKPQLHRARLELAVTYRRLHDYAKAKELAKLVLDDPKTPPNVRVTVLAFISQIDQDIKTMRSAAGHAWKPRVGLGWLYDTDVNAGPSAGSFLIEGLEYTVNSASKPRSDSAALYSAGIIHQFRPGKEISIGKSKPIFLWQDSLNYNRRDYTTERSFNQAVASFDTGPALVDLHNWRGSLDAQVDYLSLDDKDLAWFFSLLPSFTKQFANDTWEINLDGTLSRRAYQQAADEGRDSDYSSGQVAIGYNVAKPRVSIQVGGSTFTESADASNYSHDGRGAYAELAFHPWPGGILFGRASERVLKYDGREPFFDISRHDRNEQYTIGLTHAIKSDSKWLQGLSLNANYMHTDNYSNVAIYEYERELTVLMLSKEL